nr:hypothetical protein BaRGS_011968 [Batillaria attramentaria]
MFTHTLVMCQVHNLPHYVYCKACMVGVCIVCVKEGGAHSGHKWQFQDTQLEKQHKHMTEMHTSLKDFLVRIAILEKCIKEHVELFHKAREEKAEQIQKFFRTCREELETVEHNMLARLDGVVGMKCQLANEHLKQLKEASPIVEQIQAELELRMKTDYGVASSHKLLERIYKEWDSLRNLTQLHISSQLQVVCNESQMVTFRDLCSISSGCYPGACELLGHFTKRAIVGMADDLCVALKDIEGNPLTPRAEVHIDVTITPQGGEPKDVKVYYTGGNRYTFRFLPDREVKYQIEVKVKGQPIKGSPFIVQAYRLTTSWGVQQPFHACADKTKQLYKGWGMAVSLTRERLYVADRDNHTICVYKLEENAVHRALVPVYDFCFGTFGGRPGQFNKPSGIDVHDNFNRVAVVDKDNHRVQMFDLDGKYLFTFGRPAADETEERKGGVLCYPWDVAFRHDGYIAVTNSKMNNVQVFTLDGTFFHMWPPVETTDRPPIHSPRGVCWDKDRCLYITDFENDTLVVVSSDFEAHHTYICETDGPARDRQRGFYRPQGVLIDPKGFVLVCDSRNRQVLRFNPLHNVKRFSPPGQRITRGPSILKPVTVYRPKVSSLLERTLNLCLMPDGNILTLQSIQRKEHFSKVQIERKNEMIAKSKELARKASCGLTKRSQAPMKQPIITQGEHEVEENHFLLFRP